MATLATIAKAVAAILAGQGVPADINKEVNVFDDSLWNRQKFPTAGVSTLSWFGGNQTPPTSQTPDWYGNMPAGQLDNGNAFICYGMSFIPELAVAYDTGAAGGQAEGETTAAAVAITGTVRQRNDIARVFQAARINARVNNRDFVRNAYDMRRYPGGMGIDGQAAADVTAGTAATPVHDTLIAVNNGQASFLGRHQFRKPFLVDPQATLLVKADWQSTLTALAEFTIRCELHGIRIAST